VPPTKLFFRRSYQSAVLTIQVCNFTWSIKIVCGFATEYWNIVLRSPSV
jgi:hypothetical protein